MIDPITRQTCMTQDEAVQCAAMLTPLAADVRIERVGGDYADESRGYRVEIWHVNPRAGNRTLHTVSMLPSSAVEAARIVRLATGRATQRDRAAFARIAAARAAEAE